MADLGIEKDLHDELEMRLPLLGYDVIPYGDTRKIFPVVQIGEVFSRPEGRIKGVETGRVTQYVHIWHNDLNALGTVFEMKKTILDELESIPETEHYQLRQMPYGTNAEHLIDDSGMTKLRRCTIDIEYQYYKKGV